MISANDFIDVANWPLASAARTKLLANCTFNAPAGETENLRRLRQSKIAAAFTAWTEIRRLADVRCNGCNGWGHPHKKCPTWKGFTQIGQGSLIARNGLSQAKTELVVARAAHVGAHAPVPI